MPYKDPEKRKENNKCYRYRDGKHCLDCGKPICDLAEKRCITCSNIFRGDVPFTEEHKKNIAKGRLGIRPSKETREKLRKPKSLEHRRKLSAIRGSRTSNWKGGITPQSKLERQSFKYGKWRKTIIERDNCLCIICEKKGKPINAHHEFPWKDNPLLRYDPNNGVTLCVDCHRDIHIFCSPDLSRMEKGAMKQAYFEEATA